uniref:Secreted protein n=1 Tax=Ixodes ricinus TaxID=34613 RepID=A0A6B0UPW8_IXORI
MYLCTNSLALCLTLSLHSRSSTFLQCFNSLAITKCVSFRARCLKSSVLWIRPSLQSGLRNGLRQCTMWEEILDRNSSLIFLATSDVSAAAVSVFFLLVVFFTFMLMLPTVLFTFGSSYVGVPRSMS